MQVVIQQLPEWKAHEWKYEKGLPAEGFWDRHCCVLHQIKTAPFHSHTDVSTLDIYRLSGYDLLIDDVRSFRAINIGLMPYAVQQRKSLTRSSEAKYLGKLLALSIVRFWRMMIWYLLARKEYLSSYWPNKWGRDPIRDMWNQGITFRRKDERIKLLSLEFWDDPPEHNALRVTRQTSPDLIRPKFRDSFPFKDDFLSQI